MAGGIPYERKLSPSEAAEAVRESSGRAFDPEVVNAFLALNRENVSIGEDGDGRPTK